MGYQKWGEFLPRPESPDVRFIVRAKGGMLISNGTQKRLVEESERMIADTDNRLNAAANELRDLIVGFFFPHQFSVLKDLFIVSTIDPIKS